MTSVKICGLRDAGLAEAMASLPMDAIGFVFAESRRRVSAEQAREVAEAFRARSSKPPLSVGVFVDPGWDELARIARTVPLDVVQLHDRESPAMCRQVKEELGARIYKVFSVNGGQAAPEAAGQLAPYAPWIDAVMLDTHDPVHGGGSGVPFNWAVIPAYLEAARALGLPLIVAGGLNPDNVGRLLADYAPDGVDVSSGVETDGEKDIEKIRAFVERVKGR